MNVPAKKLVYIKHFPLPCQEIFAEYAPPLFPSGRFQRQPIRLAGRMVPDHHRNPWLMTLGMLTVGILRCSLSCFYKDSSLLQRIYTITHEQLQYNYFGFRPKGVVKVRFFSSPRVRVVLSALARVRILPAESPPYDRLIKSRYSYLYRSSIN
jgi:hypothetical protein